jgi:hypothetical protein
MHFLGVKTARSKVAFPAGTEFFEQERILNDGPFMSEKLTIQRFLGGARSRSVGVISAGKMATVRNTADSGT